MDEGRLMPEPESDTQLTLDGQEIPVDDVTAAGSFVEIEDGVWEERDAEGNRVRLHASSREGQKKIAANLEPGTYDPATIPIPFA